MTGRTRLRLCQGTVTGLYHRDIVIEPVAVPSARRHGKVVIFLDTNARDHCTRVVQDHLHFGRITTLPWPVKSPDLSPVVYLWDILGRRVRKRPHKPQDINELADALLEEWRRILQAAIGWLTRSMSRRCFVCLAATGGRTRY